MRVKRTSTLQVGPILREENDHKVKRETLHEEASRELATSQIDEAVVQMAGRMAEDIEEMVVRSFEEDPSVIPRYIAPVAHRDNLRANAPAGSMCITTDTGEIFVHTGGQWVIYDAGPREGTNRFLRANEFRPVDPDRGT